nr:5-oxoprolinase subunit PxpB [Neobacillus sp. Marseille-Q6967]
MEIEIEIVPLGDRAILVSFGDEISERIHRKIQQFVGSFENQRVYGVVECVPAYTTVAIYYMPSKISYKKLTEKVEDIYFSSKGTTHVESVVYKIPVYYGGETGPDLSFVAEYNQISEEDVIQIHSSQEYLIYMMGFVPGFPYLGGLSKKIAAPRLEVPRPKTAAGSVGIGGEQTGVYPAEVPSGWRIIGITPLQLFDIKKDPPSLLSSGSYVKFFPVDYEEFLHIKADEHYKVETYKKEGE